MERPKTWARKSAYMWNTPPLGAVTVCGRLRHSNGFTATVIVPVVCGSRALPRGPHVISLELKDWARSRRSQASS
eukprot:5383169-Prymnesium_polylepis.2